MVKTRLPINRFSQKENSGALSEPSGDGEKRFSDDELAQIRRDIGNRLKEAFNTDNASEIGRRLKTPPNVARLYMDGVRFPAPEMLLQFRRTTGISIEWLMTGEGSKLINLKSEFSAEEERRINEMARQSGRTFAEELRRLALAGLAAIEDYKA